MALPTFVGVGTFGNGTGSIAPGLPAGWAVGDDLYLFVESGDQVASPPNTTWTHLGHVAVTAQTRLTVFTKRAVTGEVAPTVADTGDHTLAFVVATRNGYGLPHVKVFSSGSITGTNQVQTITGGTTTENDCLILIVTTHGNDVATASYSALTNANLANLTERADSSSQQGNGGGIGIFTGELATAGAIGNTTVTNAQTDPHWAAVVLAIRPTWAPNDNFVDAVSIPYDEFAPVLETVQGSTYDANTETGEPLAIGSTTLDRTMWWKYETTWPRQIIKVRMENQPDSAPTPNHGAGLTAFRRLPSGETDVNDLVLYAPVPNGGSGSASGGFGIDSGRGNVPQPHFSQTPAGVDYARVQVTSDDPLYLQSGRRTSFGTFRDAEYDLEVTAFVPPTNDDVVDAMELLPTTSVQEAAYDLVPATGDPEFSAFVQANGNICDIGDLFYRITPTEDTSLALSLAKYNLSDSQFQVQLRLYLGDTPSGLVHVGTIFGSNAGVTPPTHEFPLVANQPYTIAIIWSHSIFTNLSQTVAQGKLQYSFVDRPANDDFIDREVLTGDDGTTSVANMQGASGEPDEPQFASRSIWYEFTPPTGGWYTFTLGAAVASSNAVTVNMYTGTDFLDMERRFFRFLFSTNTQWSAALRGGETYYIQLNGSYTVMQDFGTIDWELITPTAAVNDDYVDRVVISGASGTQAASFEGATNQAGEHPGRYYSEWGSATTWFEWVCPASGKYFFKTDNLAEGDSNLWLDMGVYTGDPFDPDVDTTKVAGNSNGQQTYGAIVGFDAVDGITYYIQVDVGTIPVGLDFFWPTPNTFDLVWGAVTADNFVFANAPELMAGEGTTGTFTLENIGAPITPDPADPDMAAVFADSGELTVGRHAWYKITPDHTGDHTFSFPFMSGDLLLMFFEGDTLATLEPMPASDNSEWDIDGKAGAEFSWSDDTNITVHLTSGETYYILIAGMLWEDEEFGESFYPDWHRRELSQATLVCDWTIDPPFNDNLASMVSTFEPRNIANLNYWATYVFNGVDQGWNVFYGTGGSRRFSNVGATAEVGEPAHAGLTATRSLWFVLRPGATGTYRIWVEGAGADPVIDPVLAVYNRATSFGALGAAIASDDDSGPGLYPTLDVALTGLTYYLIVVDARDEGEFTLNWQKLSDGTPPVNDDWADAIEIDLETPITGTVNDATVELWELPGAGFPFYSPMASVWYKYVAPSTTLGLISLTTTDPSTQEYTYIDIYEGDTPETMVNITDADNYWTGSFEDTVNVPFSMTAGETYYFRIWVDADWESAEDFTINVLAQSETPPDNDDGEDAIDVPPGGGTGTVTSPGTTDGSTFEPGEPDPNGGPIEGSFGQNAGGGTTWHKYVAPASGLIYAQVLRPGQPDQEIYRLGIYEGDTRESSIRVPWYQDFPGPPRGYFEVREGETYWIQVIRDNDQTWGDYTLSLQQKLELVDFDSETDSFTTLHNGVDFTDGILTCSGRGFNPLSDYDPQYATLDLGANTPDYGRTFRIYMEVNVVSGQVLYREQSDSFSMSLAFTSDDHLTYPTRRVGLLRVRDTAGNGQLILTLAPGANGENNIELQSSNGGYVRPYPISLGKGHGAHDRDWVGIEVVWVPTESRFRVYIDGRPMIHRTYTTESNPIYTGTMPRYIDVGMWRHPSMSAADLSNKEDAEPWTLEFRNIRITNKSRTEALDVRVRGGLGIQEFDGWKSKVPWPEDVFANFQEGRRSWEQLGLSAVHNGTEWINPGFQLTDFPDKAWGAFRTHWDALGEAGDGVRRSIKYNQVTGSQRFFGFSLHAAQFPGTVGPYVPPIEIAHTNGAAKFTLGIDGELRLAPFTSPSFCVAHLSEGEHYFIEVHCDFEVSWDVVCKVWINGQFFGEYSNKTTYAQLQAGSPNSIGQIGAFNILQSVTFGFAPPTSQQWSHDLYFTNCVLGRTNPAEPVGPVECVNVAAVQSAGIGHHIPDWPADAADRLEAVGDDAGNIHWVFFNWLSEELEAGPFNLTKINTGHERQYPFQTIFREFRERFVMFPTVAQLEANVGSGNDWTPINEGLTKHGEGAPVSSTASTKILKLTKFGCSVPPAATILGITARIHRRGAGASDDVIQLYKGGSLVGSNKAAGAWAASYEVATFGGPTDMWGTSWTPEEVNADDFGIGISASGSGTVDVDMVTIKVWFDDGGFARYFIDQAVIEFFATGSSGEMHAAGFWESGGEPGGTRGPQRPLTGTPKQLWGTGMPWEFAGDRKASVDWISGTSGDTAQITNYRGIISPEVYPRFAWSTDNGATWTWIQDVGEGASAILPDDVADDTEDNVIFLDNAAAMSRFEHNRYNRTSLGYLFPYYYISYLGDSIDADEVLAVNLYSRHRAVSGYPKEAKASAAIFSPRIGSIHGGMRRVGDFGVGDTPFNPYPGDLDTLTVKNSATGRQTITYDPDGEVWTPEAFNNMFLRLGFNNNFSNNTFTYFNVQSNGAAIYGMTYEVLVPAEPDPPPSPCGGWIDLSRIKFRGFELSDESD